MTIPVVRSLADDIDDWLGSAPPETGSDLDVPGADDHERRRLALIGGIARGLVDDAVIAAWPKAVRAWATGVGTPPAELVARIRSQLDARSDPIAAMYEGSISGRSRRSLGTFFTPPAVVDFMLDAARRLLPSPATVIDPGAGVGAFTIAAAKRWPHAELVAVDVNVVTLGLLAARGAQLRTRLHLVHEDFLAWSQSGASELPGPRLWIGNPPYTRHQTMAAGARESARRLKTDLVSSGHAGLSAYFLAAILQALRPQDAVCLLLPGSWTDTRYGAPLRTKLAAMSQREVGLVAFPSTRQLFPGTRVTGMVLFVGPQASSSRGMWSATADTVGDKVVASPATARSRDELPDGGFGIWLWRRAESAPDQPVALGSLATVRRGVATGANRFFLMTDAEASSIPSHYLRRAVRSLRGIPGYRLDQSQHDEIGRLGRRRWLLEVPGGTDPEADAGLAEWSRLAKTEVQATYIGSHREHWYSVEHVEPPDILLSPMGKGQMRSVRNLVRAVPSNAIYGLYLFDRAPDVADSLCEWLNSPDGQSGLLLRARAYGAGLFKLEPRDVRNVRVPGYLKDTASR